MSVLQTLTTVMRMQIVTILQAVLNAHVGLDMREMVEIAEVKMILVLSECHDIYLISKVYH